LRGGHEVLARHDVVDEFVHLAFEPEVAVRHDADQLAVVVNDGDAADVVLAHQHECVADGFAALDGDGVVYHAVFGTLDDSHLAGLLVDRHVLVDDADSAFTGYGDSHGRFGYGVHCGCDERHFQFDVA